MAAISDYLEDKLIRYIFRGEAFTPATTQGVALFTAAPSDSGGGTEVVTSGGTLYAREAVVTSPTGSTEWSAPASTTGLTDNVNTLEYPTAGADWGTITSVGIFDSTTVGAGNLYFFGNLTTNKIVNSGDTFKFNVGDLNVVLA